MRHKHSRVPDPNEFKTHPGNSHHIEYSSKFNPDGTITLVESGRTDIQAEINSHLGETDMAVIVHKLQFGDTSVLTSKRPMYGDFTKFPSSFAEVFDLVQRSEQAFESLPVDVKKTFDNSRAKWFSSIGSPEWLKAMGLSPASDVPSVVPNSNESEVFD